MSLRFAPTVALFGAVLAGASFASLPASFAGEITVWMWDPNFNGAAMKEAGKRYAANHAATTFKFVDFSGVELPQKLQTQLASGSTDGLPEIVLIQDYEAQKFLQSFPGAFEPLNGQIDYTQFAPYKVALATVNGQTFSVPFDTGVTGYFYRSDLLEKTGYTGKDLKDITWDRFVEIGIDVRKKTGLPMFQIDQNDPGWMRMLLQSAGSWYFDADGNVTIADNSAFKAALSAWQKLLQGGMVQLVPGWAEYSGGIAAGKAVGTLSGAWITATIKANADQSGRWAVAPIPRLDGVKGSVNASNWGGSSWYVLSASADKAEAIDFLSKVWAADSGFYQSILVNQGAFGTWLPARDGKAYSASDEFFKGAPIWLQFSEWVKQIPPVNYGVFVSEADAAVTAQVPALTNGGNIDEIAAAIDRQVRNQIQ